MLKKWYLSMILAVMVLGCLTVCVPGSGAEEIKITLLFANGAEVQAEPVDGDPDALWARAAAGTPLDQVRILLDGQDSMRCVPESGTSLSFPDAGSRLTNAAFVPLQLLDSNGGLIRTVRLYVSTVDHADHGSEEETNEPAVLIQDAPLLDADGNPHMLTGTLAKGTMVRVTGKRQSEQGPLCRLELNGELVYVPESAVSFDSAELDLSLERLFAEEDPDDRGFTYAVTLYEAGIRSGKGNNDKNLLARAGRNTLVYVFSRIPDDDGKILDLIYCPEVGVFGYIHDTQLRMLTAEEAESLLLSGEDHDDQDAEFREAAVSADAHLFSYPDQASTVIADLPEGQTIYVYTRITGNGENWFLTQVDDLLGYVPENAVRMTEENKPAENLLADIGEDQALASRYAVALSSEILLYETPSLSAPCAGRILGGEILSVLEEIPSAGGMDWYLVRAGNLQGYVLRMQTERLMIGSYLLGGPENKEADGTDE